MKAVDVQKALRRVATKERATTNAWFFKTNPGQYGEGDVFIGVTVPEGRKVAQRYKELPLQDIELLLYSKTHEDRLCALHILVLQYKNGDIKIKEKIYAFYIRHRARINNWDLVDTSASSIVGRYLYENGEWEIVLKKLTVSKSLWDRRIAIVATHYFIKKDIHEPTLAIATMLLKDTEDLIHKAVGWMLREVGKRDKNTLLGFLTLYARTMPRTTLRYAIEHFSPDERRFYMKK